MKNVAAKIDPAVSFNFSVAKAVSILLVIIGHWFFWMNFWIPTVIGLFIFGFSSSYFTAMNEGVRVDMQAFWKKKLERLGLRYWFLLFCIAALLLIQGGKVFHWHTLVHLFGLSGFLNVISGPSVSDLGRGLWFFTLLLLFYAVYPLLAKLFVTRVAAFAWSLLFGAVMYLLEQRFRLGFALYMTTFGFVFGIALGLHGTTLKKQYLIGLLLTVLQLTVILNVFLHYKGANPVLLYVISTLTCLVLLKVALPQWRVLKAVAKLEVCLLEIFLIHGYLFVKPTGNTVVDFAISMAIILPTAMLLNKVGNKVVAYVFQKLSSPSAPISLA
jgi:hypothetical protein